MQYQHIIINENSSLGLFDLRQLQSTNKRERESFGITFLLTKLLKTDSFELAYHSTGKPFLKDRVEFIAISHSHNMVAVLVNKTEETGIDIELIRDKVVKIKHKFLSETELLDFNENEIEKLLVYWSAKETVYKIYGLKNVDFIKHLMVDNFDYNKLGGEFFAHINIDTLEASFKLQYCKIDEYILVYPC